MNISPVKFSLVQHSSKPRRRVFAALLLAAVAVAALAGSALAAALVKNGSFEKDSNGDGIPNSWTRSNFGGVLPKRVCNQSYAGSCSLRFVFDLYGKEVEQTLSIGGLDGDTYKLTLWMKGNSIVDGAGRDTQVRLTFNPSGGSFWISPAAGTSAWTKYTIQEAAFENFTSITVELVSDSTSGKAWFDSVKLVEMP